MALLVGVGFAAAIARESDDDGVHYRQSTASRSEVAAALARYVGQAPAAQRDVELYGPVERVTCKAPGPARFRGAPVALCFLEFRNGVTPVACATIVDGVLYTSDRTPEVPCPRVGVPNRLE